MMTALYYFAAYIQVHFRLDLIIEANTVWTLTRSSLNMKSLQTKKHWFNILWRFQGCTRHKRIRIRNVPLCSEYNVFQIFLKH